MNEEIPEDVLIERIAQKIVDMKLETITIFFLETIGPMGRLWSQVARITMQPLLILLSPYSEAFLNILQDPAKVEKLIAKIEQSSGSR